MYQNLQIISAPSVNPFLPLDLVKSQFRQDTTVDTLEDTLINLYLNAAVRQAESTLKATLATKQYRLVLDYLPTQTNSNTNSVFNLILGNFGSFRLPKPPLISVDAISYKSYNGASTIIPSNSYVVVPGTPGRVGAAYGKFFSWTVNGAIGGSQIGSVSLEYTAGYGDPDPQTGMLGLLPENIIAGILMLAAHLYGNREATTEGSRAMLPYGVKELFDSAAQGFYI